MLVNPPKSLLALVTALATMAATGCSQQGYMPMINPNQQYNGGVLGNLTPTLPPGVTATSIAIDPAVANGRVGESFRFNLQLKGSDGKIYTEPRLVNWALVNPQLGAIDLNGVLLPQSAGTVKVTATVGGYSATATLQVAEAQFAWQQMAGPTTTTLRAVETVTRTDAWAGGDGGTMLRYFNGAWTKDMGFNFPDAKVTGLGFANTSLGWAVGSRNNGASTFVVRWNGSMWLRETVPVVEGNLTAISVTSDRDAWAVGQESSGAALILHYDGFSWKAMQTPGKGQLNAIQMLTPKLGWAVGKSSGLTPLIYKYVNGSWTSKGVIDDRGALGVTSSQELTGIKMVSETVGYVVGISHPRGSVLTGGLIKDRGEFLRYDPSRDGWVSGAYDTKTANLNQVPLHAIDMISGAEGWALGEPRQPDLTFNSNPQSIFGNLLANDGGVLRTDTGYFSGNLSGAFYGINLLPSGEGFIVGDRGVILQRTYNWRTGSNGSTYSSYGSTYGTTTGSTVSGPSNQAVTNGPGGTTVPGTGTQTTGSYYN